MDNQQPNVNKYILSKRPKRQHGFIYCYTSPSGKKYIGQTITSLNERAKNSGRGYKNCIVFWKAIQKYGFENFTVEILEEAEESLLDVKEQEWISFLNTQTPNGYNISKGGLGHSKKVYQYSLDGKFIQEFNSLTDAAKALNLQKIENISKCLHRKQKTAHGYIWDFEKYESVDPQSYIPNAPKKVYMYDLAGNFVREFCSLGEAEKILNCNHSDIKRVIQGKLRFVKNHQFSLEKKDKMPTIKSTANGGIPVCQFDKETGKLLNIYASYAEAARAVKGNATNISKCANGRNKTSYGFRWEIYEGSTTIFSQNPVSNMERESEDIV